MRLLPNGNTENVIKCCDEYPVDINDFRCHKKIYFRCLTCGNSSTPDEILEKAKRNWNKIQLKKRIK